MKPGNSKEPLDTLYVIKYNLLGGIISILTLTVPLFVVLTWNTTTTQTGETTTTSQTITKTTNPITPGSQSVNTQKKSFSPFQLTLKSLEYSPIYLQLEGPVPEGPGNRETTIEVVR